ncbi:AAA domain protein [Burkholderia thailandensis 34]|uniref:AAA family ATPase n=1 Tax=Burkholderia thailandensis TaxID=57975 RepID=UPI0005DA0D51|nr:AAA family ATPase [Burkholderia thailandensis]AJY29968.1 AAA domain protein [Burkholderia thailandensis 34]AOJ56121.1 ATPase [Burkholderia thailandensis]KXF59871.1 ATPase [Burkholderia thailandensis]PNE76076.1 ATPase [Burkholderia thailandensis]TGB35661.1 ATPase [Burkholderia thailandensis]
MLDAGVDASTDGARADAALARFFVITGGPGSGKSTLIDALAARGYARSHEAGRGVIRDQVAIGGHALPWRDRAAFAEMMLGWEMRSHHLARREHGPVFFDRGVPDVIGYLKLSALPVPAHLVAAAERFRYRRDAFIAPPWPEIYARDAERRQDYAEAVRTYDAMVDAYAACGYRLVELPRASVDERCRFVLDAVAAA